MAQRRMMSKKITQTDKFIEMPISARLLYYELNMEADDDGFVDKPKTIMRTIGTTEDDMKVLIAKSYIIPFESGVIVIKDWRINNYIQNDRYNPTIYQEEMGQLKIHKNGEYEKMYTSCIQSGNTGKDSIGKNSIYIYSRELDEIIDYLNDKLGTNYKKTSKKTKALIKARLDENFTVEDFRKVIDKKYFDWHNTEYETYLRPETLFGTKFESYLNQKRKNIKQESPKEERRRF